MEIESKKLELVKLILETDSEQLLAKVKKMLKPARGADETANLMANKQMKDKINKSLHEANEGKTHSLNLDDLWN